ncbi:hypothetical protein C0995_010248 [Termitomyces sp. Mi166|nr:hypothetical protein C0995_010248 [Termitomyces sp. Mi166\
MRILQENSMLKSACTPHHAPLVIELEISGKLMAIATLRPNHILTPVSSGYISTRPPSLFNLGTTIANAIQKFVNLSKIALCPATFHEELFIQSLGVLPNIPNLRELAVNTSCTGERTCPLLMRIEGLRRLTLDSPGRIILDALPAWLDDLNIDEEQQLRTPNTIPKLTHLKYFAANYNPVYDKREVIALCRWVKWVISSSPIEHVCLLRDDQGPDATHIPFDNLIEHLAMKHASTLRIVDFREAYVSAEAAKSLLERCHSLEEVYVAARKRVLDVFQEHARHLPRLCTAGFNIRNAKMKRALVDDDLATRMIMEGPPSLRMLAVNGAAWEVGNMGV